MGGIYSTLRIFNTVEPSVLRKNAYVIILSLALPKFIWDLILFRNSGSLLKQQTEENELKERKKMHDNPQIVLSVSVQKAIKEMRELVNHCLSLHYHTNIL